MENRPVCRKKWVRRREVTPPRLSAIKAKLLDRLRRSRSDPCYFNEKVLCRSPQRSVRPGTIDWLRQGECGVRCNLVGQVQATQSVQRIRNLIGKCDCFPQAPHLAQAMVPGQIFFC